MNRRRPITADHLDFLVTQINEDDLAVLATLDRLRLVTGPQLQALHHGEGEAAKQRRIRQLSRLSRLGLVVRLTRRVGGPQAGSYPSIYTLDAAAQRLLHPDSRARRPWTPSHPFLAHAIAVSELYVAVVEATKAIGAAVATFAVEPECWRSHQAGLGQQTVLKPDAHAVIVTDEEEYHWFIEVDRSTENATRLAAKCRAHVGYWHTGDEDRRHGVSPQVLWVVPDERRRAQVLKVIRCLDPNDWPLFAVTITEHAAAVLCGLAPIGGAS